MSYQAAADLLQLANQLFKDKILFLGRTTEATFTVIKTTNDDVNIPIFDNKTIPLKETYCHQIYFGNAESIIINDATLHPVTENLAITKKLHIRSYIDVPIHYKNGEVFGTICAIDSKPSTFTENDIEILERFSKLFSYVIELEKKVKYDVLTELYNRRFLYDNFDFITTEGTLMLLDMDGFKSVNDTFGHDVGDLVLKEVANILRKLEIPFPIRLGGDEFVLLFPNVIDTENVERMATTVLKYLSNWSNFEYPVKVSASLGISRFFEESNDLSTILKKADAAMYLAKVKGKNRYEFYKQCSLDKETSKQ
ncbi:sensor domain-containing diguanylate cyclase [Bacillus alkalicellulosilyticus]|uniref:sensor domain-containing diguanylate cyclase n=1 Tax=Alkalihalobacterium alkalicellulosilyticum TaxID=1912214 RepID=UPI0009966A81|nr:sensor domain-containing diguanylate cyclase [Bacillus alkalicellulosilyticus]